MLHFDSKGFLKPAQNLPTTLAIFEQEFVVNFNNRAKRQVLFDEFKRFFQAFFEATELNEVSLWVNGSFVTKKENPNDIDFVFFLDSELANKFADVLSQKFTHPESKELFQMDAFLLRVFPTDHPDHFFTLSDRAYWFELFSETRKDRRGHSFKKGFIELKISRHEV